MFKKYLIFVLIFALFAVFHISCENVGDSGVQAVSSEDTGDIASEDPYNEERENPDGAGNEAPEPPGVQTVVNDPPDDVYNSDPPEEISVVTVEETPEETPEEIANTYPESNPDALPPGQPESGYGSNAGYICDDQSVDKIHWSIFSSAAGKKVYIYMPEVLKNGSSAPVVIYLHGFMAITPLLYMKHIKHLTQQGYIVIFPQFNKEYWGMMTDMDQEAMLERAIVSTNDALDKLGSKAELDKITIFGHSVGGLLAVCWSYHPEAPAPRNIVLAEAQIDPTQNGIPEIIQPLVVGMMTLLDWKTESKAATCPVTLLVGNQDWMATPEMAMDIYNELTNASAKVVYLATSDRYGHPTLVADHMAPVCLEGTLEDIISNYGAAEPYVQFLFGNTLALDAMDYRFFWAACDAALDGLTSVPFDMGTWSDGRPVTPVEPMAP